MTKDTRFGATPVHLNEILASAKKGDIASFGILYVQNAQGVYDFIYAQVIDSALAQDLTEETFVNVWNNLSEVSSAQDLELFLFKHAYQILTRYQKHLNGENVSQIGAVAINPKLVRVLFLYNSCNFTFEQISSITGSPAFWVKRLHRRGLKRLHNSLRPSSTSYQESLEQYFSQLPTPDLHRNFFLRSMYRLNALLKAAQTQERIRAWQQENQLVRQPPRGPQFAFRTVIAAISILVLFFGSTGVVSAAQNSFPGDELYSTKLVIEDTQLKFSLSDYADLRLRTQFSNRRLDEINYLIETGQFRLLDLPIENLAGHLAAISVYSDGNHLIYLELAQQVQGLILKTQDQFEEINQIKTSLPNSTLSVISLTTSNLQLVVQANPLFISQPNQLKEGVIQSVQGTVETFVSDPAQGQEPDNTFYDFKVEGVPSLTVDSPVDQASQSQPLPAPPAETKGDKDVNDSHDEPDDKDEDEDQDHDHDFDNNNLEEDNEIDQETHKKPK